MAYEFWSKCLSHRPFEASLCNCNCQESSGFTLIRGDILETASRIEIMMFLDRCLKIVPVRKCARKERLLLMKSRGVWASSPQPPMLVAQVESLRTSHPPGNSRPHNSASRRTRLLVLGQRRRQLDIPKVVFAFAYIGSEKGDHSAAFRKITQLFIPVPDPT
jgi:hypothetical protein